MPRIGRIGLILVDYAGYAFHIDGDVTRIEASMWVGRLTRG
jgi:hypothetical protein